MEASLLLFQLALIFLPGLIWARLDVSYAAKTKPSDMEFVLRAFMFGLTSYAVTFVIYSLIGLPFIFADFAQAEHATVLTAEVAREIIVAVLLSVCLALAWIYAATYKLLTRFLQKIGATKTYGDEDVWDFTFNSRNAAVEYVHVRDFLNQIVYAGWVNTVSETNKLRELILRDVEIFTFNGEKMFAVPLLYIEFPYVPPTPGQFRGVSR